MLQKFRFGTFKTILEHRLPLFYALVVGNSDAWPPTTMVGGFPADIHILLDRFPVDYEKDDAASVSERLRATMQKELDRIYAEREKKFSDNREEKRK